jgi:hypothetical protein
MKFMTALLLLAWVLAAPTAQAERIARSGSFTIDLDSVHPENGGVGVMSRDNALQNPGFESGELLPWTTNNWSVTDADAASGTYCAHDIGNYWIRQDFDPIDVGSINAIMLSAKQPEATISAVDFFYSDVDYDEFLIWPLAEWSVFDVTEELREVGSLVAIRVYGYSGGGPDDDLTLIDDVLIDSDVVAADATNWGAIKALYR